MSLADDILTKYSSFGGYKPVSPSDDVLNKHEEDEGYFTRGLHAVGSVLGAPKAGIDWLAREGARAQGLKVGDDATVGSMLRSGFGLSQGDEGYAGRLAGKGVEFAGDVAADPLTWAMGGLGGAVRAGKTAEAAIAAGGRLAPEALGALAPESLAAAAKAARVGRFAAPVQKGASAAFTGLMGAGTLHEGSRALEGFQREGFTPQVAEETLGTALSGLGAAAGVAHFLPKTLKAEPVTRLNDRLKFYERKGMGEEARLVKEELASRPDFSEEFAPPAPKVEPPVVKPSPLFEQDVRAEAASRVPWAQDTTAYLDELKQARPDDFARHVANLEAVLKGDQGATAATPAEPIQPRSPGTLEGDALAAARGDRGDVAAAENAALGDAGIPPVAPALDASQPSTVIPFKPTPEYEALRRQNAARQEVPLPAAFRQLRDQALEIGADPDLVAQAMRTTSGRETLRRIVRDNPAQPRSFVMPEGERKMPAWEGALTGEKPVPERPELIAQQQAAFAENPEAAQVFQDVKPVVSQAEARRLKNQEEYKARKEAARVASRAEAERLLLENEPRRLPLIPEPETQGEVKFATAQSRQAEPFYSQLRRVVDLPKTPQAARGGDFLKYLSDPNKGIKADELKWTGLDDFLRERAGQKVTKTEIQGFLDQNRVEVKEVMLSDKFKGKTKTPEEWTEEAGRLEREAQRWQRNGDEERAQRLFTQAEEATRNAEGLDPETGGTAGMPKFSQYQLPGGENYRELLLTLPAKADAELPPGYVVRQIADGPQAGLWEVRTPDGHRTGFAARTREEAINDAASGSVTQLSQARTDVFRSGHFDESNILAHVRFNDRVDAEGKKVLFLEELQSDWAQKGRREGFQLGSEVTAPMDSEYRALVHKNADARAAGREPNPADIARAQELEAALERSDRSKIPSAPFVGKTEAWTELALKRMLRYAAENGYDRVAWTPGEMQAKRYDLSKQVKAIYYKKNADGTFHVFAEHKTGGGSTNLGKALKESELEGAIGKDVAARIAAGEGAETNLGGGGTLQMDMWTSLTGHNLKVGGEGMKGYYDQILPAVAGKLGKKWGAKVGEAEIDSGATSQWQAIDANGRVIFTDLDRARVQRFADLKGLAVHSRDMSKVHAIDITPEMRRSVTEEGLPLFAAREGAAEGSLTFDQIRSALPNAKFEPHPEGGYSFTLPGQRKGRVLPNAEIEFDTAAFRKGYGREPLPGEAPIGSFQRMGPEVIIRLAKHAEEGTVHHEAFHAAMDMALNNKQKRAILKQYGSEEAAADAYGKWKPSEQAHGLFQRIADFFARIYRAFAPTWESTFKAVRSGEAYEPNVLERGAAKLGDLLSPGEVPASEGTQYGEPALATRVQQRAPRLRENRLWPEQLDQIPRSVLSLMNKRLKSLGFDVRGPDDVLALLRKREGRFPQADWFTAYNDAVASLEKASATRKRGAEAMPHVNMATLRRLGTTTEPSAAGYIRPDGSLVNMSGDGITRGEDHRIVGGTAGMQELVANGHIRWMPEGNGLDLAKEPTPAQYKRIEELAARADGEMILDLEDGLGEWDSGNEFYRSAPRKTSLEYPSGTNPRRIAGDIRRFFAGEDIQSGTRYATNVKEPVQQGIPGIAPESPPPSAGDMVREAYINSLVSGPGTHIINPISNIGEAGARVVESFLAGPVDKILTTLAGGPRTRFSGEALEQVKGGIKNVPGAFGVLSDGLKNVVKSEGALPGKAGKVARTPTQLLGVEDAFTAHMNRGAVEHGVAYRQATKRLPGASASEIQALKQQIIESQHPDFIKQVEREVGLRQFKGDIDTPEDAVSRLNAFREQHKWLYAVFPFTRTPAEIAKLAAQRTPFGFAKAAKAIRVWKAAEKKGAPTETLAKLKGEAVDALTRPIFGTAALGAFAAYAKAGGMTGAGPTDQREKSLKRETGWQPYSFVIPLEGGRNAYIPFNRFEPVSTLLGFAADMAEAKDLKTGEEVANKAIGSIVSNLSSKTYLQGLADAAEFVNNPTRFAGSYLSSMSSALVPNLIAKGAQAIDPTLRDVTPSSPGLAGLPERVGKTLMARVPGVSTMLPARRTATGQEVTRPGVGISRLLSPVQITTDKPEAGLERLILESNYVPGQPSRDIAIPGSGGKRIRLNDSEFRLMQESNRKAADYLRSNEAKLARMKPEERAKVIRSVYDRARDQAREKLFRNPTFRSRVRQEIAVS